MLRVKQLKEERLHNGFLKVDRLTFVQEKPDGVWTEPFCRELMLRGNAAAVLVHDPKLNKFLFTKQIRPGAFIKGGNPWVTEIVAGMIDKGENGYTTVKREALEETGIEIHNIEYINRFYPSVGGSSEEVEIYYAQADLSNTVEWLGCADENEIIQVLTYTVEESLEMLKRGELATAANQVALYWFMANKL